MATPFTEVRDRFLRLAEVKRISGLSNTTIWRRERAGDFPQRRRLGPNSVGWLASEIDVWIADRSGASPR